MSSDSTPVPEPRSRVYTIAVLVVLAAVAMRVFGDHGVPLAVLSRLHPLHVTVLVSLFGAFMTHKLIRGFTPILIKAGMYGIDLSKDPTDPPTKV